MGIQSDRTPIGRCGLDRAAPVGGIWPCGLLSDGFIGRRTWVVVSGDTLGPPVSASRSGNRFQQTSAGCLRRITRHSQITADLSICIDGLQIHDLHCFSREAILQQTPLRQQHTVQSRDFGCCVSMRHGARRPRNRSTDPRETRNEKRQTFLEWITMPIQARITLHRPKRLQRRGRHEHQNRCKSHIPPTHTRQ